MRKLMIITMAILLLSCKKEESCVSDSGEATFWMNQETAAKIGIDKVMTYYINDEYKAKSTSSYFMLKQPACGEYYDSIIHLPVNCGDKWKVEKLETGEVLFSGEITIGPNNCVVLQMK